jgi:hypothetical protein
MEPRLHAWILGDSTSSLEILEKKGVMIHYIQTHHSLSISMKELWPMDWVLILFPKDKIRPDLFDVLKEKDEVDVIIGLHSVESDHVDPSSFKVTEREGLSGTFIRFHLLSEKPEMSIFKRITEFSTFEALFEMKKPVNPNCNNGPQIPIKIISQTKPSIEGVRKEKGTVAPYSSYFRFQNTIETLNRGIRFPPQQTPSKMIEMIELKKTMNEFNFLSSLLQKLVEDSLQISEYVDKRIEELDLLFR